MDSSSIGMIVALVILVICSAYFSATETAFTSLNTIRMKTWAENGDRRAARTLALAEDYDKLLSTILIGNNIVNISTSTIATVLFTKLFFEYGPTISTVVITLVVFVIFSATAFKGESFHWNHVAACVCLILAVYFVFMK